MHRWGVLRLSQVGRGKRIQENPGGRGGGGEQKKKKTQAYLREREGKRIGKLSGGED